MSFVITLDLGQILLILAIPTLILFFGAIALNLGDYTGSFIKSIYIKRIIDENMKLQKEHKKWREEFKKDDDRND